MKIFTFLDPKHQVNVYLVVANDKRTGILIDPASISEKMIEIIEKNRIDLKYVLITHDHVGHVEALGTLKKIYDIKAYSYLGRCQGYETEKIKDGDLLLLGESKVKVMHLPGHSLDSMAYLIESSVFTGDTLLSGSIARTNTLIEKELLVKMIQEKIFSLDDNTLLFPAHGCPSKVRIEKMFNQDMLEATAMMT